MGISVIIIVQSQPEAGNGKTENIFMKNRPIVSKPQFIAIKYLNLSTTKIFFFRFGCINKVWMLKKIRTVCRNCRREQGIDDISLFLAEVSQVYLQNGIAM